MNAIVIFELPDQSLDWRMGGQMLPAGAVVREVTVSRGDAAQTVELHEDYTIRNAVIALRNSAIEELAESGWW